LIGKYVRSVKKLTEKMAQFDEMLIAYYNSEVNILNEVRGLLWKMKSQRLKAEKTRTVS
jgi:hypothetical protein